MTASTSFPLPPQAQRLEALSTRHETPCGDGRTVWHAWGPESGPPVVLLHGGSGSWTHWLRAIEPLVAAGRRVWAPDLPGFGDSSSPPRGDDADALPAPLEAGLAQLLGPRTAVDLVGFSFGGLVAGLLAAAYPQRPRRLVLVGAPALGVVDHRQADLHGWRHLDDDAARDEIHRHNLAALMLHERAAIDDEALALHRANVLRDRMPRRRLAFTDALALALPNVGCPVHAIYGEHDVIYRGHERELERAIERAAPRLVRMQWIAGAGHWVQHERPDEFNAALARALGQAPDIADGDARSAPQVFPS